MVVAKHRQREFPLVSVLSHTKNTLCVTWSSSRRSDTHRCTETRQQWHRHAGQRSKGFFADCALPLSLSGFCSPDVIDGLPVQRAHTLFTETVWKKGEKQSVIESSWGGGQNLASLKVFTERNFLSLFPDNLSCSISVKVSWSNSFYIYYTGFGRPSIS